VDVAYTKTKSKELSLTPQKRGSQVQPQVETPTKRRRVCIYDNFLFGLKDNVNILSAYIGDKV